MSIGHKTSLCTRIKRCEHQNQNFEWLMSESEYEFRARNFLISRPDAPVNSIMHTSFAKTIYTTVVVLLIFWK